MAASEPFRGQGRTVRSLAGACRGIGRCGVSVRPRVLGGRWCAPVWRAILARRFGALVHSPELARHMDTVVDLMSAEDTFANTEQCDKASTFFK